jgi:DNA-binding MarR family transcriptional regulator
MQHTSINMGSAKAVPAKCVIIELPSAGAAKQPVAVHPFPLSPIGRQARAMMKARARRSQYFRESLFSDPAWDILLDLFIAAADGGRRTVSTVGLAGNVPSTTALRWINALEREGLVAREPDPRDARRVFLDLTEAGISAMRSYFDSIQER